MSRGSERGVVAGAEALAFGVLVLVVGTAVVVFAWGVLTTRATLDAAAAEYLRAYTEAADGPAAIAAGRDAALWVLHGRGRPPGGIRWDEPDPDRFGPCEPVSVTLRADSPGIRLPGGRVFGPVEVEVTHHELVDARREIRPGPDHDPTRTPCAD